MAKNRPKYRKITLQFFFHPDQVVTYICIRADNFKLFFARFPSLRSQVVVLATPSFRLNQNGDKCNIKTQLSHDKANLHIRKPLANIKVIQRIRLFLRVYSFIIDPSGTYYISCFESETYLQIFLPKID